jgi:hypothetical protein
MHIAYLQEVNTDRIRITRRSIELCNDYYIIYCDIDLRDIYTLHEYKQASIALHRFLIQISLDQLTED